MTLGTRFVPWVRRAELADNLHVRALSQDVEVPLAHLGPGDVIGIDAREIVQRVPPPRSVGFPPNLFPMVELRSADLPWRLSSATTPWLALIVREARETALPHGTGPLPLVELAATDLPSIDELPLWCHAQVAGDLSESVESASERGIARVIAPRRLAPRTRYVACLVPCCDAGRLAGLGQQPADPRALAPAWTPGTATILPVYDHWFFTTGEAGDFEALARRLGPRVLVPSALPWMVDVSAAGEPGPQGAIVPLFTSLVPKAHVDPPLGAAATARVAAWLESVAAADTAVIGPPLYGGLAAGAARPEPGWLADANLDPRRRAAAALGAEVVRRAQDDLVAQAWAQLGDLRRANRERDLAHLGAAVTHRWVAKHLASLPAAQGLVVTAPTQARIRAGGGVLADAVARSALPTAMLSPGFRRLATTHGRANAVAIATSVADTSRRRVPVGAPSPGAADLMTMSQARTLGLAVPPTARAHGDHPPAPATHGESRAASHRALVRHGVARLRARVVRRLAITRPGVLDVEAIAGAATDALRRTTALERQRARVRLGDVVREPSATAPWVAEISLDVPVGDLVRALDARHVVASIDVPPDSVGVLTPHAAFIEAVMLGANHELVRELRWRGAAIDPHATPLRRYFDVRGQTTPAPLDLPPVATWARASRLGTHLTSRDQTVVVVRGELVRRFSDALVFAVRATRHGTGRAPSWASVDRIETAFRGTITDDTIFVGFARSPTELRDEGGLGWYIVIAERPTGPRFGLDEPGPRGGFATWADLAWTDVEVVDGTLAVRRRTPAPTSAHGWIWGRDGAHMAAITAQRPMRVAFHAQDLLGKASA